MSDHGRESQVRTAEVVPTPLVALRELVAAMHLVFENDWGHTQSCLQDDGTASISPGGTFLNPLVKDERDNWWNRGELLESYRRAVDVLRQLDLDPTDLTRDPDAPHEPRYLPDLSASRIGGILAAALTDAMNAPHSVQVKSLRYKDAADESILRDKDHAEMRLVVAYPNARAVAWRTQMDSMTARLESEARERRKQREAEIEAELAAQKRESEERAAEAITEREPEAPVDWRAELRKAGARPPGDGAAR